MEDDNINHAAAAASIIDWQMRLLVPQKGVLETQETDVLPKLAADDIA